MPEGEIGLLVGKLEHRSGNLGGKSLAHGIVDDLANAFRSGLLQIAIQRSAKFIARRNRHKGSNLAHECPLVDGRRRV